MTWEKIKEKERGNASTIIAHSNLGINEDLFNTSLSSQECVNQFVFVKEKLGQNMGSKPSF